MLASQEALLASQEALPASQEAMRLPLVVCLSLFVIAVTSCVPQKMLEETRARQDQIETDVIRFYENVADAYFLVGWEYFELAQEMEKSGKTEASQKYASKARVFSEFSKELKRNAQQVRDRSSRGFPAAASKPEQPM